jgi:hypothetical protein
MPRNEELPSWIYDKNNTVSSTEGKLLLKNCEAVYFYYLCNLKS